MNLLFCKFDERNYFTLKILSTEMLIYLENYIKFGCKETYEIRKGWRKSTFSRFFPQLDAIENMWEEKTHVTPQKSNLFLYVTLHDSLNEDR